MKKAILFLSLIIVIAACNKDKFKTEPQVEIKSITPSQAIKGQNITLTAIVRDKEGDLQDSVFVVPKRYSDATLLTYDTLRYYIGNFAFPEKQQIETQIIFAYGELSPGAIYIPLEQVDRQFAVGIIVRDKAGNKSQYVESEKITLKKL